MRKHAGTKELFAQIQTADGTKVSLKINSELTVRVTRDLVEELESLLGSGSVQLGGDGQRRLRRRQQQQQQLFAQSIAQEPMADDSAVTAIDDEP